VNEVGKVTCGLSRHLVKIFRIILIFLMLMGRLHMMRWDILIHQIFY